MKPISSKAKKVRQIGAERDDFKLEIETVPVVIRKTFTGRIIDAAWMVAAAAIATTIVHAFIIPLLA